jgi:hypothetical protein
MSAVTSLPRCHRPGVSLTGSSRQCGLTCSRFPNVTGDSGGTSPYSIISCGVEFDSLDQITTRGIGRDGWREVRGCCHVWHEDSAQPRGCGRGPMNAPGHSRGNMDPLTSAGESRGPCVQQVKPNDPRALETASGPRTVREVCLSGLLLPEYHDGTRADLGTGATVECGTGPSRKEDPATRTARNPCRFSPPCWNRRPSPAACGS